MRVYHGTPKENLEINEFHLSRYGFWAMFFTDRKKLAKNYAIDPQSSAPGSIYEFEIKEPLTKIEMNFAVSYNSEFRNEIHIGFKERKPSILFKNVLDSPDINNTPLLPCDILVVYDRNEILKFEKVNC